MSLLGRLFGGRKMAALVPGTPAPPFELPYMEAGKGFSLQDALARGPVLAIFFKISCPVCQYGMPFYERLYKAHGGSRVTIIGISQNERKDTADFLHRFGVTIPTLLDDTKSFPVSNAYGLSNVPTTFWIAPTGEIEIASVGWSRADFEEIARKVAASNNAQPAVIFQPTEHIADFRAG